MSLTNQRLFNNSFFKSEQDMEKELFEIISRIENLTFGNRTKLYNTMPLQEKQTLKEIVHF